jgi:hypothetical protein
MSPLTKIQSVLAKPFMPAVFFISGVTYDTFTLTRIDRLLDNLRPNRKVRRSPDS